MCQSESTSGRSILSQDRVIPPRRIISSPPTTGGKMRDLITPFPLIVGHGPAMIRGPTVGRPHRGKTNIQRVGHYFYFFTLLFFIQQGNGVRIVDPPPREGQNSDPKKDRGRIEVNKMWGTLGAPPRRPCASPRGPPVRTPPRS